MSARYVECPEESGRDFGRRNLVGRHRLQEHELFREAALIELLDGVPRDQLHVLSMGTDPLRPEENQAVQHDGVSGAELLQAVRAGRLWVNVTRVERADARFRHLIDALHGELGASLPGFAPYASQGNLLISSPHALVYYHADGPASLLWHVRGRKRAWVYPALDRRYVTTEMLEDIMAGVRHEYLPYQSGFDAAAEVIDLEPGQWISWPQNAPHRISNLDSVNVSLVTEHFTPATRRRFQVYAANRFLRTRFGWRQPSLREHGPLALAKVLAHRVVRRLGLDPMQFKRHTPTLRMVAGVPGRVVPLAAADPARQIAA
jgi:hypothetical protein